MNLRMLLARRSPSALSVTQPGDGAPAPDGGPDGGNDDGPEGGDGGGDEGGDGDGE